MEFISLDVNVRFVEVLSFLPGRDDHDLGFFQHWRPSYFRHTNWIFPCRSLFSFSSISCTFFPQTLIVETSAYMSTSPIVLVLMGMSFINTIKNSGPKIEPCGTPIVISDCSDCLPLNKTNYLRSDRYAENHRTDCYEHPYMANLSSKIVVLFPSPKRVQLIYGYNCVLIHGLHCASKQLTPCDTLPSLCIFKTTHSTPSYKDFLHIWITNNFPNRKTHLYNLITLIVTVTYYGCKSTWQITKT